MISTTFVISAFADLSSFTVVVVMIATITTCLFTVSYVRFVSTHIMIKIL